MLLLTSHRIFITNTTRYCTTRYCSAITPIIQRRTGCIITGKKWILQSGKILENLVCASGPQMGMIPKKGHPLINWYRIFGAKRVK